MTEAKVEVKAVFATVEEFKAHLDRGEPSTVLDVRHISEWEDRSEKLPGAIWVDAENPHVDESWPRDQCTMVYCACPHEERAIPVVSRLYEAGFTKAFALKGGIAGWKAAGGSVEAK